MTGARKRALGWAEPFMPRKGENQLALREGSALPCPFSREKVRSSIRRIPDAAITAFQLSRRVGDGVAMATVDQSSMRGLVTA
jgi:hypothetical protein